MPAQMAVGGARYGQLGTSWTCRGAVSPREPPDLACYGHGMSLWLAGPISATHYLICAKIQCQNPVEPVENGRANGLAAQPQGQIGLWDWMTGDMSQ